MVFEYNIPQDTVETVKPLYTLQDWPKHAITPESRETYGELRRPLSEVQGCEQDFYTQAGLQVAELV